MRHKLNIVKLAPRIAFSLLLVFNFGSSVFAQGPVTLFIGDKAPELKYSKWIKGTPIKSLDDRGIHVVEFWATWCGPCIAQMPHISELAEKYKGKVDFIGANAWEKTGDKPYESSLPNVLKFVEGNSKNMRYNIIADTKDQFMLNNWLKAGGINSIPTTFIIQNGKIAWIGSPSVLENILDPLLAGTYDVKGNQEKYNSQMRARSNANREQAKTYKALTDAMAAKNYKRVVFVIDSMGKVSPEMKANLVYAKFDALLKVDHKSALELAKELSKTDERIGGTLSVSIAGQEGLSKELYQFGAEHLKDFKPMNSIIANMVAFMQAGSGDFTSAALSQQKAIDLAKVELTDPKFSGRVFEYNIKDYERKLKQYKTRAK